MLLFLIETSMMEMRLSPMVVSVLVISILACAWKLLCLVWLTPKKLERCLRQQGIPGTPYRLLLHDLRESMRVTKEAHSRPITPWSSNDVAPRVLPFPYQSIQKYGKICFTWIGPVPVLNIMDAEMVKEILSRKNEFEKPQAIGDLTSFGLLTYRGEQWAKHRKIINPAFYIEKLKHVVSAACSSCEEMKSKWEKKVIAAVDGLCEVDVWRDLDHLSGDVISRAAFGSNYEESKEIFLLLEEQTGLISQIIQLAFIPGWSLLPNKLIRRMKRIKRELRSFLKDIVTKREKAMKEREEGGGDDLLGLMLRSNLKEIQESGHRHRGMSMDEVIEECKTFYFAGQETTSKWLTWTLILLSKHQDWQAKARQEVLKVFGDSKPHFDGLQSLKIVSMILNEVLRLYPPSIRTIRAAQKPTKLRDIVIPPGVHLFLPTLLIHHDRQLWGEDAAEFKPERFAEGVSTAPQNQRCFLPFGWGPRTCIGQNFALLEAKAVIAMILQSFTFELSASYKHAPLQLLTLRPQYGAPLILRKVKSS